MARDFIDCELLKKWLNCDNDGSRQQSKVIKSKISSLFFFQLSFFDDYYQSDNLVLQIEVLMYVLCFPFGEKGQRGMCIFVK